MSGEKKEKEQRYPRGHRDSQRTPRVSKKRWSGKNRNKKRQGEPGPYKEWKMIGLLGVGAAFESGTIVVGAVAIVGAVGIAGLLFVGLLGLGAQSGLAGLIVLHLTSKHDVAEAGLHGIEFG